jgi:branched-chain amino acid transport system ATP-binding protein
VLVVEQNVQNALDVADRAYVMSQGVIVRQRPAASSWRERRARGAARV